jgi:hypothetical protein
MPDNFGLRISTLQAELAELKIQRKRDKLIAKITSRWIAVKDSFPSDDTMRVIVWVDGKMERCWYSNEKFYVYDGTFFLTEKDRVENVTHWMMRDWMCSREWPKHGPGLRNKLRYIWKRLTYGAQDTAHDLRPKGWSKTAQLGKKPVFYKDASGKIMGGLPENIPSPRGYEKIVCGSALEAERYSSIQRRQEQVEHRYQQEQRGAVEAEFIGQIRSDRRTLMANARNNANRDFLRRAEEMSAGRKDPTAYERESYLHAEAYEKNH